jgi:GT2 family glycosyltransferase
MKVAVILLTLGRNDLTKQVIKQNFYNSGYDADCILVDNGSTDKEFTELFEMYNWHCSTTTTKKRGIAAGVNTGLRLTSDYDGVCILANDILLPINWLQTWVAYAKKIPKTGIIGIHCVESLPPLVNGIHETHTPFGDNFITRELIDAIGGYNTEFDPYGQQDKDFAERAILAGFTNYYLPNMRSEHIGHDVGDGSEYRKAKDESLQKSSAVWDKYQPIYHEQKQLYIKP